MEINAERLLTLAEMMERDAGDGIPEISDRAGLASSLAT
jgi:hypothetical protein